MLSSNKKKSSTTVIYLQNNETQVAHSEIPPSACKTYKRLKLIQIIQSTVKTLLTQYTLSSSKQASYTAAVMNGTTIQVFRKHEPCYNKILSRHSKK